MLFKRALCERATLEHVGLSRGRRSADRTGENRIQKTQAGGVVVFRVIASDVVLVSVFKKSDWLRGNQTRAYSVLSVHLS